MTEEKRATHRHRTLKGGKIVLNNGHSTFDCTVRNLSDAGAKLIVASIVGIPRTFVLAMDDGRRFSCESIWQKDGEIGVRFV